MRRLILTLGVLAVAAPAVAAPRVASIGLCGDQIAGVLLDDDRIAGLSHQADDPALSMVAARAATLPRVPPSAEAVLMAGADMVVANRFGDTKTANLLQKLGVPVLRVDSAESLDQARDILRQAGERLEAAVPARELAARMETRREGLRQAIPTTPMLAAYYRPDGGSAGSGTSVDAAMQEAGMESLATRLGMKGWGRLDLETLVMNPPQVFAVSFFDTEPYSARRSFARHPVARRMMAALPVVEVPARLWSCGGWPLVEAAEFLSRHHHVGNLP